LSIRAITFDVGGTLIEPWPSVGHVYAEVAAHFGVNGVAPDELTCGFIRAWKAQQNFDYSRAGWYAIIRAAFASTTTALPEEFFPALYDRFAESDVWHVYPDVLPTLKALSEHGLKLGIISNWDERLRPLLVRLGLAEHFTCQVISCEIGAPKPDARLFKHAAAELGVAPGELLHVGDSYAFDVVGANAAGAHGRQVERRQPLTADWQIASLDQLLPTISRH
jgi:putative hydrolase of the HAD superfamily